ncbi:MAG: hypothetical protein BZ138_01325 [Methanosphaera sp. rholeuAM270]|nr:MAG: hypothetical protein BZ138_01325 [Methanosphaera sp. rholeuAM270]
MEINNILDALIMNDVSEIIQYCECEYNGKKIEFKLINDDIGVIDEIEFKNSDAEYVLEYDDESDEDINLIIKAINNAPMEVFHKSDVGATLILNYDKIKPQNVPIHLRTEFYVDENGPLKFTLIKNEVKLD